MLSLTEWGVQEITPSGSPSKRLTKPGLCMDVNPGEAESWWIKAWSFSLTLECKLELLGLPWGSWWGSMDGPPSSSPCWGEFAFKFDKWSSSKDSSEAHWRWPKLRNLWASWPYKHCHLPFQGSRRAHPPLASTWIFSWRETFPSSNGPKLGPRVETQLSSCVCWLEVDKRH